MSYLKRRLINNTKLDELYTMTYQLAFKFPKIKKHTQASSTTN